MSNACVRVVCLTRAVTRITHMSGTVGNEAVIAREQVTTPNGERREVPALSGNALRHVCVRSPGVRWLVDEYGLDGKLTLAQLNFLFHGGALTESTGREPTARVAEMHECWPILKLLGGALPDQILQGSLRAGPGVLVCEENRDRLAAIVGAGCLDGLPRLTPSEQFVESYQYATYGAKEKEQALAERATDFAASESDPRMLYVGQCVRAGAIFAHEFTLAYPTDADVGCLLWSLELWQQGGGTVGGMGRIGHGRTETVAMIDGADGAARLMGHYRTHAGAMKDRATAWLNAAFGIGAEKPAKAKGKRGKSAESPA